MTSAIPSGASDQSSSSGTEPWISGGGPSPGRRRYRIAKTISVIEIKSAKKPLTPIRKRYSASTCAAEVEALSGNSGRSGHIASPGPARLPAEHDGEEDPETRDRRDPSDPHRHQRGKTVAAGR